MANKDKNSRNERGAAMWLLGVATLTVIIGLIVFQLKVFIFGDVSQRHRFAVEAAAIAASENLQLIMISDPVYGYVGLADYPAGFARAAVNGGGAAMPVHGINTVLAAARLDLLISKQLSDPTLVLMARQQAEQANDAAERLKSALRAAVNKDNSVRSLAKDLDGQPLNLTEKAQQMYSLTFFGLSRPQVHELKIELGHLADGASTITPLPQPLEMALLPTNSAQGGHYKAFIDAPVDNIHFRFAALSSKPALVDQHKFVADNFPATNNFICDIVKVSATTEAATGPGNDSAKVKVIGAACAQCGGAADSLPAGSLVVHLRNGRPTGIDSLRQLMLNDLPAGATPLPATATNGDYPDDPAAFIEYDARVNQDDTVIRSISSGFMRRALLSWLRNQRCHPRIDSSVELINTRFSSYISGQLHGPVQESSPVLIYNFDSNGDAQVVTQLANPFASVKVPESQLMLNCPVFSTDASGHSWGMTVRNVTETLAARKNGKHGGLPLAAEPEKHIEVNNAIAGKVDGPALLNNGLAVDVEVFLNSRPIVHVGQLPSGGS
jgi:hypothetical protein